MPDATAHPLIRRGSPADAAAASLVVARVLNEHGLAFDPDHLDADIRAPQTHYEASGGAFFVAVERGAVVGTAALVRSGCASGELRKLFLLPQVRGCGLGRRLLDVVLAAARARGLQRITLTTRDCYGPALRLYEQSGFRRAGAAGRWRGDDPGVTYVLELDVLELDAFLAAA